MSTGIATSPADLAEQRRYDAGLDLRAARRAALADPFSCHNGARIAQATAAVDAAQADLDALQNHSDQTASIRKAI